MKNLKLRVWEWFELWTRSSYSPASQRFPWRDICLRMSECEVIPLTLCKITSTRTISFQKHSSKAGNLEARLSELGWAFSLHCCLELYTGRKVNGWISSKLQPKRGHQLQGYLPIRSLVKSIFHKQTLTDRQHLCQCYRLIGYRRLNTLMILLEGVWDRCLWKVVEGVLMYLFAVLLPLVFIFNNAPSLCLVSCAHRPDLLLRQEVFREG